MLENLRNKVKSVDPEELKEFGKSVLVGMAMGIVIKAGTYIVVEGTKALIEELTNRTAE